MLHQQRWALRLACLGVSLAASLGAVAQDSKAPEQAPASRAASKDDAFDLFRSNSKESTPDSKQSGGTSKPATAKQPKSTGSGREMNVYCSGTAQQYTGPMATFSDTFEFRTTLDFAAKTHRVVNVMSGKIFRSGSTYDLLELPSDMVVLSAESVEPKWKITTLQLDLAVGKLTGQGAVDLSALRSRILRRVNEAVPSAEGQIPENGFDEARNVKINGTCQKL